MKKIALVTIALLMIWLPSLDRNPRGGIEVRVGAPAEAICWPWCWAERRARDLREAAERVARQVREAAERAAQQARELAERVAREAREAAERAAQAAREAAERARQLAEETARRAREAAEREFARLNPTLPIPVLGCTVSLKPDKLPDDLEACGRTALDKAISTLGLSEFFAQDATGTASPPANSGSLRECIDKIPPDPGCFLRDIKGRINRIVRELMARVPRGVAAIANRILSKVIPVSLRAQTPQSCQFDIEPQDLVDPRGLGGRVVQCASDAADALVDALMNALGELGTKAFSLISHQLLPLLSDVVDTLTRTHKKGQSFQDNLTRAMLDAVTKLIDKGLTKVFGSNPADLGKNLASAFERIPLIGAKLGGVISTAYAKGYSLARNKIGPAVLTALTAGLSTLSNKLGAAAIASLAGTLKVIKEIAKLADEAQKKVKPVIDCVTRGALKKKNQMVVLAKDIIANPARAVAGLFKSGWSLVRAKVPALFRVLGRVLDPTKLVNAVMSGTSNAQEVDPEQYDDAIADKIPQVMGMVLEKVALDVPDAVRDAIDVLLKGQWPFECVAPTARAIYKQSRSAIGGVVKSVVGLLPRMWKGVSSKFSEILGYVLQIVSEVLSSDSMFAKVQSVVNGMYIGKLGALDQMVTEARRVVRNPGASPAKALALARRFQNENPFMTLTFWLNLLKGPIQEELTTWIERALADTTELLWRMFDVGYKVFEVVIDYVGAFIPWVSDVGTTVVEVITTVASVVYRVARFVVQKVVLGVVIGKIVPKLLKASLGAGFKLLGVAAKKLDELATPVRTGRKLPFKGPVAIIASGVEKLFNTLVKPYIGRMQVHVSFISGLVRKIAERGRAGGSCTKTTWQNETPAGGKR